MIGKSSRAEQKRAEQSRYQLMTAESNIVTPLSTDVSR